MKESEIKHIFACGDKQKPERELYFTEYITSYGRAANTSLMPEDYDNVRHLRGNLYLAWDDISNRPYVYVGELR